MQRQLSPISEGSVLILLSLDLTLALKTEKVVNNVIILNKMNARYLLLSYCCILYLSAPLSLLQPLQ